MAKPTLKELNTYTDWARDKAFELVRELSDEQLDRAFEMGLGSIRNTLHHIWAAERIWLDRWTVGGQPKFVQPEAGLPLAELHERARATAAERDGLLAKKTEAELGAKLTFTNIKGETYSLPLGGQMLHVCNHGIYHRAQFMNMFRRVGGAVPPRGLDYVFFRLEMPATPAVEVETIRQYQRYADWGTRRLLAITSKLPDAQLDRRIEMGQGSIRDTLAHLRDAETWWYENWTVGPGKGFPDPQDKPSMANVSRQLEEAWSRRDGFVSKLTDADMARGVQVQPRPDRRISFPLGVSLIQLCGHATHHRAQVVNMLRHCGAETPGLDLTLWLRDMEGR